MFFGLAFFISGLFINVIQFILYNTLAWIDIQRFRRINFYLNYSMWSQVVALGHWWADTELTIYYPDENSLKLSAPNHMLCLMNHTFEIDWVMSWLAVDHYQKLGNAKSFVKRSLRFIPIIGWSWIFGEFAFLERNLEKDSANIVKALKNFLQFEHPTSLLFFAEGTRFTEQKHENSIQFAKERGLPELKYHLLPRPRGFNLAVRTFKEEKKDVLVAQIQLRFPKNQPEPSFTTLLRGDKLKADMYVRIFPLSDIPTDSEKETTDCLYKIYQNQDELADYHEKNDCFPGVKTVVHRRKASLLNLMAWTGVTSILLPYILAKIVINSSWLVISIIAAIIVFGLFSFKMMIDSTKVNKSSSSYGMENKKKQQ